MAERRTSSKSRSTVNIWKYLFWTLLLIVTVMLTSLSYFGIVHFNYVDRVNINTGIEYRRSAVELSDWMKAASKVVEKTVTDNEDESNSGGGQLNEDEGVIMKDHGAEESIAQEKEADKKKEKSRVAKESELLQFHSKAVDEIIAQNIEKNLEYLSSKSHLGGTDESGEMAEWIAERFKKYHLDDVNLKTYKTLVSYPKEPGQLILFDNEGKENQRIVVLEKKLDNFEKTTKFSIYPPFLAYSMPSTEEGEMIYANFGSSEDFRSLKGMNITCKDKILLIRYGMLARNKKIKFAENCGAKAVILFSDPSTYSPTGAYYPDTWYLPPDGVMRGTLARLRGDALTRGYPAIDGLYKRPVEEVTYFPKIPVQPIGYGDAEKLLKTLDGQAPPSKDWNGGLNITYNVTSRNERKVKLLVNVTKELRDITNVIGIIEGASEPDRIVLIGNHRDAWGYGAADPSSGTAVMVEVARVLGKLKKEGWRPRRTILICSWDAEEFGLLGSTEWTEEYSKILAQQAVAYINVDTAVQGNHTIELKSTPELIDVFFDASRRWIDYKVDIGGTTTKVEGESNGRTAFLIKFMAEQLCKFKDPDSNANLYDSWLSKHKVNKQDSKKEPNVNIFREGSDYMPFYGDLGIPSMDMRYMFDTDALGVWNIPVYHTMHDNIAWMKKFVDPDFRYHAIIAQVLTRVILLIADSTLLPFNLIRYSERLMARIQKLDKMIVKNKLDDELDISLLKKTTKKLNEVTRRFHKNVQELDKEDELAIRQVNDQMILFERTFVANEDLLGDDKTRHVYHTAGLNRAVSSLIRSKKKKNKKQYKKSLEEFQYKYSVFTYHVMMSIHALENPFIKRKMNKDEMTN